MILHVPHSEMLISNCYDAICQSFKECKQSSDYIYSRSIVHLEACAPARLVRVPSSTTAVVLHEKTFPVGPHAVMLR